MIPRWRSAILLAAVVGLLGLLGGCATKPVEGSPVATSAVDLPPSYRFVPTAIAVTAGTTVTWTNRDHFTHSVQFLDGDLPAAPLVMEPGASTGFAFDTPGLYQYRCHLHPQNMQGTVTVGP